MREVPLEMAIRDALSAGRFFVAPHGKLRMEAERELEIPFEIFRGHLLDVPFAQKRETFDAWHLFLDDEETGDRTPIISLLWHKGAKRLHVTRQILTHGYQAVEESPGVIESRPIEKWVRELVGTIDHSEVTDEQLLEHLRCYVTQAIFGTSRLPVTSVESPLPAFSLGRLAYLPALAKGHEPIRDAVDGFIASCGSSDATVAIALETALRAGSQDQLGRLRQFLCKAVALDPARCARLEHAVRTLFNQVSLSPYTQLCDELVKLLLDVAQVSTSARVMAIDSIGYMIRHLCRHLTAFDLVMFHNSGANYPDALFLDSLLTAYGKLIDESPQEFSGTDLRERRRRRALRQGYLLRQTYEGHRVPDSPTSPGENARVLPKPFERVPEEQLSELSQRRRRLFAGATVEQMLNPAAKEVLDDCLADLANDAELQELGTAQFLDRPFGVFKEPGEVDRTSLVSYQAFSGNIARRRVRQLRVLKWINEETERRLLARIDGLRLVGVPAATFAFEERPGVVSLCDAARASSDFVLVRSGRLAGTELLKPYADETLSAIARQIWLVIRESPVDPSKGLVVLAFHDRQGSVLCKVAFGPAIRGGSLYREWLGKEYVDRMQVLELEGTTVSPPRELVFRKFA